MILAKGRKLVINKRKLPIIAVLCSALLIGFSNTSHLQAQASAQEEVKSQPEIQSISLDGENVLVKVWVPEGLKKIVLEGRSSFGKGTWVPRSVEHISGEGAQTITFTIPRSQELDMLRVRAASKSPLPESFYKGESEFNGNKSEAPITPEGDNRFAVDAGADLAPTEEDDRDVQESDIWAFRGNTLYFFNRLEGLQVIDVSNPNENNVIKRFYLPAAGEEMYVIDDNHVALQVRDWCGFISNETGSQIVVLDVSKDEPEITGSIGIPGNILETRLVGTVLYAASSEYKREVDEEGNNIWTQGTTVSSIDLSNPQEPKQSGSIFVPGWSQAVQATSSFFFVATRGQYPYYNSTVHVVDISDTEGTISLKSQIRVDGWIRDKFKINSQGETLSLIYEVRSDRGRLRHTQLTNYSLSNPERPNKLGSVALGENETLFATRFDGDRVYIVTFLRIDPLWIVDNSNPSKPTILGELEIPGWSTYIHPMGDRLITMGIDNTEGRKPAVQLFDVSNPAKPSLLSKVPLGEKWAWSEANYNEKAFKVLEDQGMVLVPYSSWFGGDNATGTRIIDFNESDLTLRGLIEHDFTPRRATVYNDLIYSISNHELVTVDPADRDEPEVLDELILANSVDKVVEMGDFLISGSLPWYGSRKVTLSVVRKDDQHSILSQLEFSPENPDSSDLDLNYSLSSLIKNGDNVYAILTSDAFQPKLDLPPTPDPDAKPPVNNNAYVSNVYIASIALDQETSQLSILSEDQQLIEDIGWRPQLKSQFLDDENMILYSSGSGYYWPMFFSDARIGVPFYGSQSMSFISVDLNDSGAIEISKVFQPEFANDPESQFYSHFSEFYWAGSRVMFSTTHSEYVPDVIPGLGIVFGGRWHTENTLRSFDFADPENPTPFPAIDLPGRLVGLSHEGQVVYSVGQIYSNDGELVESQLHLQASAYDETSVKLIDNIPFNNSLYSSLSISNGIVYSEYANSEYKITSIRLSEEGKLVQGGQISFETWINDLVEKDGMVFANSYRSLGIVAADFSDLDNPKIIKSWETPGCIYPQLREMSGSLENGYWAPLGTYGIIHFSFDEE